MQTNCALLVKVRIVVALLEVIKLLLKLFIAPPLPTDDIMDLLNLCLTSMYFQHYKQLHGTAMGSPVSVVVVEKEQALATYTRTIPLWLRYVDDTFTAVLKDGIDDFREHLNG